VEQHSHLELLAFFIRKGEHHDVELSCAKVFNKARGQVFDKIKPQVRIDAAEMG
jgi:hypothetical protein